VKPTEDRLSKLGNLRKWVYTNYEPDVAQARVHAFIQCMRWTGLATTDALKLYRKDLEQDRGENKHDCDYGRTELFGNELAADSTSLQERASQAQRKVRCQ